MLLWCLSGPGMMECMLRDHAHVERVHTVYMSARETTRKAVLHANTVNT